MFFLVENSTILFFETFPYIPTNITNLTHFPLVPNTLSSDALWILRYSNMMSDDNGKKIRSKYLYPSVFVEHFKKVTARNSARDLETGAGTFCMERNMQVISHLDQVTLYFLNK